MSTSVVAIKDTGRQISKVDVIADAYSRLRISGLTVNPTPEDLEIALIRLEDMMAMWQSRNIDVNYFFEDIPDPNSLTNVNAAYKMALSLNLAALLIPDFNKQVPQILYQQASAALDNISGRTALQRLNQVPYPRRQAIGSGNSLRWNRWNRFYRESNYQPNVNKSEQIFVGDINDYVENFDSYLNENEVIQSFDIQLDSGLELVSSAISADLISVEYRIKALNPSNSDNNYVSQVTIIITTDFGRVETRRVFFNVSFARSDS